MTTKGTGTRRMMSLAAIVERYLRFINGPRAAGWSPERFEEVRKGIEKKLASEELTMVQQLKLIQQLNDLEGRTTADDPTAEFVKIAKEYSDHNGISAKTWREMGVPAPVLRQAKILPQKK